MLEKFLYYDSLFTRADLSRIAGRYTKSC